MKKPNQMDSRNRDAREVMADLAALGKKRCRLTIAGSHKLDASATAEALRDQWSSIVELIGFEPVRIITGCAPVGAEKAARLVAKDVTGKLAAVFHRPDMVYGTRNAEVFMNVPLSKAGDVLLILSAGKKKTCDRLRGCFAEWSKKVYEVEIS